MKHTFHNFKALKYSQVTEGNIVNLSVEKRIPLSQEKEKNSIQRIILPERQVLKTKSNKGGVSSRTLQA